MKKEYTTLSVDVSLKERLEQQMFKIGKRLSYNDIIDYLINFHDRNHQLIDDIKNKNN